MRLSLKVLLNLAFAGYEHVCLLLDGVKSTVVQNTQCRRSTDAVCLDCMVINLDVSTL